MCKAPHPPEGAPLCFPPAQVTSARLAAPGSTLWVSEDPRAQREASRLRSRTPAAWFPRAGPGRTRCSDRLPAVWTPPGGRLLEQPPQPCAQAAQKHGNHIPNQTDGNRVKPCDNSPSENRELSRCSRTRTREQGGSACRGGGLASVQRHRSGDGAVPLHQEWRVLSKNMYVYVYSHHF